LKREKEKEQCLEISQGADNCCGQQKNKYLLSLYAYAVAKYPILRSITHKYLIVGHTQNEGDNVHSVIEKQVKRYMKANAIYVPDEYITLIRSAKKNGRPYNVTEFHHTDFYDLKKLQEDWGNNFAIDDEKRKVVWQDIKIFKVEKNYPRAFFYKTSYTDTTFRKVNVHPRIRGSSDLNKWTSIELRKAYSRNFVLAENKNVDLQDLVRKNIIPEKYHRSFYNSVLH
jgi:hypothetical protein